MRILNILLLCIYFLLISNNFYFAIETNNQFLKLNKNSKNNNYIKTCNDNFHEIKDCIQNSISNEKKHKKLHEELIKIQIKIDEVQKEMEKLQEDIQRNNENQNFTFNFQISNEGRIFFNIINNETLDFFDLFQENVNSLFSQLQKHILLFKFNKINGKLQKNQQKLNNWEILFNKYNIKKKENEKHLKDLLLHIIYVKIEKAMSNDINEKFFNDLWEEIKKYENQMEKIFFYSSIPTMIKNSDEIIKNYKYMNITKNLTISEQIKISSENRDILANMNELEEKINSYFNNN